MSLRSVPKLPVALVLLGSCWLTGDNPNALTASLFIFTIAAMILLHRLARWRFRTEGLGDVCLGTKTVRHVLFLFGAVLLINLAAPFDEPTNPSEQLFLGIVGAVLLTISLSLLLHTGLAVRADEAILRRLGAPPVKGAYSFLASTDASVPLDKATADQIFPYAWQQLRETSSEFDQLYDRVDRADGPHAQGTGTAKSRDEFGDAFFAWLEKSGIHLADAKPLIDKQIFVFSGDAKNPKDGSSFPWSVLTYFDLGE